MADTSCRHPVAAVSAERSPAVIMVAGSATIQNQGQGLRLHFTLKGFLGKLCLEKSFIRKVANHYINYSVLKK